MSNVSCCYFVIALRLNFDIVAQFTGICISVISLVVTAFFALYTHSSYPFCHSLVFFSCFKNLTIWTFALTVFSNSLSKHEVEVIAEAYLSEL